MGQAFSGLTDRVQSDSNSGEHNGDNPSEQSQGQPQESSSRSSSSRRSSQRSRPGASAQLPYVLIPRTAVSVSRNQSRDRQSAQAANLIRMINSFRENPSQNQLPRRQSSRTNSSQEPSSLSNLSSFPPLPLTPGFPFQPGSIPRPRNNPSGISPRGPFTPNDFSSLSNPPGGSQLGGVPETENPSVLNQILTAAASAINLTTAEYQQRMDSAAANGEPSQSARTAASFMDSFLDHLQRTTNEADNPFPRLSLISESVNSDEDPNTTSIFRIFRMQQGSEESSQTRDNNQPGSEVASETNTQNTSNDSQSEANTHENNNMGGQASNELVPVLIIGIRSIPNRPSGMPTEDANPPVEPAAPRLPRTRSSGLNATNEPPSPRPTEPSQATSEDESRTSNQRRSWVIYVIGSTYPATHPILTTAMSDNPSYEDLLMLSTLLGPARPPTTTQEAIDAQFEEVVFDEYLPGVTGIALLNGNRCQVCLCDYEPKDKLRILKCQHAYHTSCIDRWLTQGSNNCPVCRRSGTVKQAKAEPQPGPPSEEGGDGTSLVGLVHDPPRN